jgi:hypothetical protein
MNARYIPSPKTLARGTLFTALILLSAHTPGLPPILRRWMRLPILLGYVLFVVFIASSSLEIAQPGWLYALTKHYSDFHVSQIAIVLLLAIAFVIWLLVSCVCVTAIRHKLQDHRFALCLKCGYSLTGAQLHGICSECGSPFSLRNVRYEWRHWFARRSKNRIDAPEWERVTPRNQPQLGVWLSPHAFSRHIRVALLSSHKSMPRVLQKRRSFRKVAALVVIVLVVLSVVYESYIEYALACLALGMIAFVIVDYSYARRVRRAVEVNCQALCTNCGHSLLGLSERSNCPQCGLSYDLVQVRRTWRDLFG